MQLEPELGLHPDAAKNFDEKAKELTSRLIPFDPSQQGEPPFKPELFPVATITEDEMIGGIQILSRGELYGKISEMYFPRGDQFVGLAGESFMALQTLAEAVQKTRSFRQHVSQEFVLKKTLQWLRGRLEQTTDTTFSDYIVEEARHSVAPTEIWIPLFGFHVQSELPVGRVTIRTITKQMLDQAEEERKSADAQNAETVAQLFQKWRRELQAAPAATINLVAEPIRAHEIAFEEAEKSVSALRFFDPAICLPELRSYWAMLGLERRATATYLTVRDGKILTRTDNALLKGRPGALLDHAAITTIRASGLDTVGGILAKREGDRDDFETVLLGAILLYSKNALAEDVSDRLVYILAALELVLLRDGSEAIEKNLGERMAFLIGTTTADRQAVVKNTSETYALRSAFVHHGQSIKDLRTVAKFMRNAWACVSALISRVGIARSKQQLIDALEERKMS